MLVRAGRENLKAYGHERSTREFARYQPGAAMMDAWLPHRLQPWTSCAGKRRRCRPSQRLMAPRVCRCLARSSMVQQGQPCSWLWSGRSGWVGGVLVWAVEWLLATHTAKGLLIPRPWIDHPYGEEEITLLEEELLPAMAGFLERVEAIDRAIEADQEQEFKAHQAR